jgi:hypothetical protein
MDAPRAGGRYVVELCSGERRCWRCLGTDARGLVWWRDEESGAEFNEGSLMYAWQLVGEAPAEE